jgi:hypothetical protein
MVTLRSPTLQKGEAISTHYLISVEYFGRRGGFEAILDRLEDKKNRPPLLIIELLLRAVVYVCTSPIYTMRLKASRPRAVVMVA